MRLKRGVDDRMVHPVLWVMLGQIGLLHRLWTGAELTITSLRRQPGSRRSKHAPPDGADCTAGDLRVHDLRPGDEREAFARVLQVKFGKLIGVVLEPDWLTPGEIKRRGGRKKIAPHIHIQLKRLHWPRVL